MFPILFYFLEESNLYHIFEECPRGLYGTYLRSGLSVGELREDIVLDKVYYIREIDTSINTCFFVWGWWGG